VSASSTVPVTDDLRPTRASATIDHTGDTVLQLSGVSKAYGEIVALADVDLTIRRGEFVAIVGPSGSGKSTMLNVMGTLDRPTSGSVLLNGQDVGALGDDDVSRLRSEHIGFVFQQFHLAVGSTATENVADGLLYSGVGRAQRRERARAALTRVGLAHRLDHRPHELSGGERQRVAIARAVVGDPSLVLADEPTGALDSVSGAAVLELLRDLNDAGTTLVVITHDLDLARRLPRRVRMRDGAVVGDSAEGADATSAPADTGAAR
jgi:putative ABC transport system ATP-binding protein